MRYLRLEMTPEGRVAVVKRPVDPGILIEGGEETALEEAMVRHRLMLAAALKIPELRLLGSPSFVGGADDLKAYYDQVRVTYANLFRPAERFYANLAQWLTRQRLYRARLLKPRRHRGVILRRKRS